MNSKVNKLNCIALALLLLVYVVWGEETPITWVLDYRSDHDTDASISHDALYDANFKTYSRGKN